jgi:hypothetical protein
VLASAGGGDVALRVVLTPGSTPAIMPGDGPVMLANDSLRFLVGIAASQSKQVPVGDDRRLGATRRSS